MPGQRLYVGVENKIATLRIAIGLTMIPMVIAKGAHVLFTTFTILKIRINMPVPAYFFHTQWADQTFWRKMPASSGIRDAPRVFRYPCSGLPAQEWDFILFRFRLISVVQNLTSFLLLFLRFLRAMLNMHTKKPVHLNDIAQRSPLFFELHSIF